MRPERRAKIAETTVERRDSSEDSAPSPHSCRWRRYGHHLVANMRGDLRLEVLVNGRASEAHSTYTWAGGGMVLTISTVLPERGLAVELISTYVGHPHTPTVVTHLMLGPPGRRAQIRSVERGHEDLDPIEGARECAYDHAQELIDAVGRVGYEISVQLDERTFAQLERVE